MASQQIRPGSETLATEGALGAEGLTALMKLRAGSDAVLPPGPLEHGWARRFAWERLLK